MATAAVEVTNVDLLPTRALVELINAEDARVAPAVGATAAAILAGGAIGYVLARMSGGGRLPRAAA